MIGGIYNAIKKTASFLASSSQPEPEPDPLPVEPSDTRSRLSVGSSQAMWDVLPFEDMDMFDVEIPEELLTSTPRSLTRRSGSAKLATNYGTLEVDG